MLEGTKGRSIKGRRGTLLPFGYLRMAMFIVSLAVAGCMEESPELMMGQDGAAPPPPGGAQQPEGPNPGNPAPEGAAGNPEGGQPVGEGAQGPQPLGEGIANAEGAPNGGGAPGGEVAAGGLPLPGAPGEGAPGTGDGNVANPPAGAAAPEGQPPSGAVGAPPSGTEGQAAGNTSSSPSEAAGGTQDGSQGLLARLFSSQQTGSSQTGFVPSGGQTGSPGLPRVQETVADKAMYSEDDLKDSDDTVTLKGSVSCSVCKGTILLNIVSSKGLVVSVPGLKPGEFSILVPKSVGEVTVTAIGDDNADGVPTQGEALGGYMKNPITVKDDDITDISIQIGKSPPPPSTSP